MRIGARLRALVPTRAQIHDSRWLRHLGPWLRQPTLWRWSRRGVAMGVALGVFFGLLVPIAQIPLSVTAAVVLRANVPAAAVSTLVTNPLTFAPLYYVAYRLGHWITGDPVATTGAGASGAQAPDLPREDAGLWQRLHSLGRPLLIGLSIMATLAGLSVYALITLVWHGWTWAKRYRRRPR